MISEKLQAEGEQVLQRLCKDHGVDRAGIRVYHAPKWLRQANAHACKRNKPEGHRYMLWATLIMAGFILTFLNIMSISTIHIGLSGSNLWLILSGFAFTAFYLGLYVWWFIYLSNIWVYCEYLKTPNMHLIFMITIPPAIYVSVLMHEFFHIKDAELEETNLWSEMVTNQRTGVQYFKYFGVEPPVIQSGHWGEPTLFRDMRCFRKKYLPAMIKRWRALL